MNTQQSISLKGAKNIGPTIEKRLHEVGIFTLGDLAEVTPVNAYNKIKQNYPNKTIPVCYYLYSLQGALLDIHWNDLPSGMKEALKSSLTDKAS